MGKNAYSDLSLSQDDNCPIDRASGVDDSLLSKKSKLYSVKIYRPCAMSDMFCNFTSDGLASIHIFCSNWGESKYTHTHTKKTIVLQTTVKFQSSREAYKYTYKCNYGFTLQW